MEVLLQGSTMTPQRFMDWFQRVCRENREVSFGIVPRGFKRVVCLQNMGGSYDQKTTVTQIRNAGRVVQITKDEAKAYKRPRNNVAGWPAIVDCPAIKGKMSDSKAYKIVEAIHMTIYGVEKYSSFQSFTQVKRR